MVSESPTFATPPATENDDGAPRGVGFELEFSGLTLDRAAAAVRTALGATPASETAAERVLAVDGLGEFTVEVDWAFLKRKADEESDAAGDAGEDGAGWLETLSEAAALLVPIEVVCPPIPVTELDRLHPAPPAPRSR